MSRAPFLTRLAASPSRLPLVARLTAWYVGLLALVVVALGSFVVVRLDRDLTGTVDRDLRSAVAQIAVGYGAEGVAEFRDASRSLLSGEQPAAQVLTPAGGVLARYGDATVAARPLLPERVTARARRSNDVLLLTTGIGGHEFRVAARAVPGRGRREVIAVAASLAPVHRSADQLRLLVLAALPIALLVTATGGWLLARRALRPVGAMAATAAAIGVGDQTSRVPVPVARDELHRLAVTLNAMLARISAGAQEQRRLVADTSHELRTPLAAMRSELDVSLRADHLLPAARDVLESQREEVDRLAVTVDGLLALAAADDRRLAVTSEAVRLDQEAASVLAVLRPLAEARSTRLLLTSEPVEVLGDRARLGEAIRNLLDNALKFGPDGREVRVIVRADEPDAVVVVEDDGPGIPEPIRDRVFERFYRQDASRTRTTPGSGLGLAIVREIATAHRGQVSVSAADEGGARFVLRLPLRAADRG